jgi:osmotically-inducible protein OsmY
MDRDKTLQKTILEALDYEPGVNAANIGVTSHEGIVTLTGHVPSYLEKRDAVRCTRRITGVKGVADEIEIRLAAEHERTDEDIARASVDALNWSPNLPFGQIKAVVRKGSVTLEGKVRWPYQKTTAERVVQALVGVVNVNNNIAIEPAVMPQDVKGRIERALERSAELEAKAITVETVGGTVTLRGQVRSLVERDQAERAAWAAPGVTRVVDNLIVRAA